jgi:hypothetical protein
MSAPNGLIYDIITWKDGAPAVFRHRPGETQTPMNTIVGFCSTRFENLFQAENWAYHDGKRKAPMYDGQLFSEREEIS